MNVIEIGLQIGLQYGPLALGIYLAMGVLSLPDLTLEGSFGIGGSTCAVLLVHGANPGLSLAAAMAAGAGAGLITALLHIRLRLNVLLAGILMATAAWSISLIIMNSGNLSLLTESTVYTWAMNAGLSLSASAIVVGVVACAVTAGFLMFFLRTEYGLSLRAAGMNIQTARGIGVRTEYRQVVGLMIANALAACSGSLVVQSQGFMDVTIQSGVIVVGLAALMIGRSIVHSPRVIPAVLGVLLGIVLYRIIVTWALELGLNPNYLKLATAVVVVAVVALRANARGLIAFPGTSLGRKARRARTEFYEGDHVANFL